MKKNLQEITLASLLAAVYALISLLPGFPIIGLSGSSISLTRSLDICYGLILGPVLGPFSAFLGAVLGKTLVGSSLFFTLPAIVSAFMAAALNRDHIIKLNGWLLSVIPLTGLIICWYLTPVGREALYYPVPHIIGLGIIFLFRGKITNYLQSQDKKRLTFGVLLSAYPSTMAGHMLGNLIFMLLSNTNAIFFLTLLPLSIVERLTLTAIAAVISVPLILVTRNLYPEENLSKMR
ncbi:MAG: hypothetical protein QG670_80 [Thermoproteota archaeon]|nr:hypothetical protein [Thermoproteota archaeon]